MAYLSEHPVSHSLTQILHRIAAFYGRCVAKTLDVRHAELLKLSDQELAERGLSRPEVVDRHFGDLFYS